MRNFWTVIVLAVMSLALPVTCVGVNNQHEFVSGKAGVSPQQPQIAVAPDGSIYVAYGSENSIYCAFSRDQGETFSEPVLVANEGPLALGMHRGPRIAATRDSVVITAIVGRQGKGQDGNLLAWRSGDQARSWSKSVIVNDAADSAREGLHGMASGQGNVLFAAWLDLRSLIPGKSGTELYGAFSADGGKTWSRNALIYRSPDGSICQCCHPSVAIDAKGAVYAMWRNSLMGMRDMYLAVSSDGGKTFGSAKKLGTGSWPLNACPMDGGDITVSSKLEIRSIWRRQDEVFLAAGRKLEQRVGKGRNPVLVSTAKGEYIAWQDESQKSAVLLTPGATTPIPLGTNSAYVDLCAGPGSKVIAAWEETEQGKKKVKIQILG